MNDKQMNAMLQELSTQRSFLGDRAVSLAAANAELLSQNEALKARIAELEKPKDA